MVRVTTNQDHFVIDGKEIRIISGAIHYFRVVPQYWEDRLRKLKACGFNTVETYMPWNLHEPKEGEFDFKGLLDLEKFLNVAQKLGLYAIVRPGPYICAEWEFGGLPAWLLAKDDIHLRCMDETYLKCVENYFHEVCRHLRFHLLENGGNVIMMQVENEYGSYGMDHEYMQYIADLYKKEQMNVFLFTSDGDDLSMLNGGTLPDVFKVVNFGSDAKRNFTNLRHFLPEGPLMCGEFWNGWFDHWGEAHHVRGADDTAAELENILDLGGSVNFYMFHGGTNFNFWNGANHYGVYQPTVTSYDYHCLLNESGDRTEKYYACQKVLEKHGYIAEKIDVEDLPKAAYGRLDLDEYALLFDQLSTLETHMKKSAYTLPMEKLGQNFGFVLYRTYLKGPFQRRLLTIKEVHDRACVYGNGKYLGLIERDQASDEIYLEVAKGESYCLDILVENMGRVNYGPEIYDCKGITHGVYLGLQEVHNWEMYSLELKNFSKVIYEKAQATNMPAIYRGYLDVEKPLDTFIYLDGFSKGNVYINGFNIGRFFDRGPQRSLYVPGPLLKPGQNVIEVFSVHGAVKPSVTFKDVPDLG